MPAVPPKPESRPLPRTEQKVGAGSPCRQACTRYRYPKQEISTRPTRHQHPKQEISTVPHGISTPYKRSAPSHMASVPQTRDQHHPKRHQHPKQKISTRPTRHQYPKQEISTGPKRHPYKTYAYSPRAHDLQGMYAAAA